MSGLRIQLFGTFRVWRNEDVVDSADWRRQTSRQLLKLLLTRPDHAFGRDEIADALWPHHGTESSQRSLRVTVSILRKVLEPNLVRGADSRYIVRRRPGYAFARDAPCRVDAWDCERLYATATEALADGRLEVAAASLEEACALAADEYLLEDPFAPWAGDLRRHWQERRLSMWSMLAECRARLGAYDRALDACRRGLALDAFREDLHRQTMLYHYCAGRQSAALEAFRTYCELVRQEFDTPPSPGLERLRVQIEAREVEGVDGQRVFPEIEPRPMLPYSFGRTDFVGREQELSWLEDHARTAREKRTGRAVVLVGEAGVGKTRLIEEFLGHARERGSQIFAGRCFERDFGPPLEPVMDALREVWPGPGTEHVSAPDAYAAGGIPSHGGEENAHRVLAAALLRSVRHYEHGATILFVDDLQWADPATLSFLTRAAERAACEPLLLIATYRREAAVELRPWLDRLAERRLLASRSLAPLSRAETGTFTSYLASRLFGETELLSAFLHRESEGNPLYLVEYLRWLVESGVLSTDEHGRIRRLERGRIDSGGLPSGVRSLLQARLRRLDADERAFLDPAAVLGRDFDVDTIHASPAGGGTGADVLARLVTKGLVVEAHDGSYRFFHERLRDAVYEQLPLARRRALHRFVAGELEERGAEPAEVAHHFVRAQAWPQAVATLELATRRAESGQDWSSALAFCERALEAHVHLAHDDAGRFDLLALRDRLQEHLDLGRERAETVREMLELATRLSDPARHGEALLRAIGFADDPEAATDVALRHFRRIGDGEGEARAQRALGHRLWRRGDYPEALRANHLALTLHRALGNEAGQAGDATNIAQVHLDLEEYEEALLWAEKAYRLHERRDDQYGMAFVSWHLAAVFRARGELETALHWTLEGLQHHRSSGGKYFTAVKHNQCAVLYLALGTSEEALAHFRSAARLSEEVGSTTEEANAHVGVGMALEALDDPEGASAAYESAIALLPTPRSESEREVQLAVRTDALTLLARVLHRSMGLTDEASVAYSQAAEAARALGDGPRLTKILLAAGGLHWHARDLGASRRTYEEALERAESTGDAAYEGASLASLSVVYRELDLLGEAVRAGRRALRILRVLDDRRAEAYVLRSVGRSYARLDRAARACACLDRSLRLQRALGDEEAVVGLLDELVDTHRKFGDEACATRYAADAARRRTRQRRGAATAHPSS